MNPPDTPEPPHHSSTVAHQPHWLLHPVWGQAAMIWPQIKTKTTHPCRTCNDSSKSPAIACTSDCQGPTSPTRLTTRSKTQSLARASIPGNRPAFVQRQLSSPTSLLIKPHGHNGAHKYGRTISNAAEDPLIPPLTIPQNEPLCSKNSATYKTSTQSPQPMVPPSRNSAR